MKNTTFGLGAALLFAAPLQAATLMVDNGNPQAADTNIGTMQAPFKTIGAAAKIVKAGDEVVVRPGVYREAVTLAVSGTPGAPVTFRSERPGAAIIDGADVIAPAALRAEEGGVYSFAAPNINLNPYWDDGSFGEWIYLNDEPLERVKERAQLAPQTFWEDYEAKRILFKPATGVDAATARVEFAVRDGLMSPAPQPINNVKPLDDVRIIGFTLRHNADWFGGRSAINFRGQRWLIEGNSIRWSSWRGMHAQVSSHCIVRNNLIEWCGDTGVSASTNYNLLFEGNKVLHCNWRRINPNFDGGFGKFALCIDSRVVNNESAYHYGFGPWFDIHNMGNVVDGNVSRDSIGGYGLFSEISTDTTFLNNVVYNIRDSGLTIGESIGCVARHNIAWNNGTGLQVRGDYTRRNDHGALEGANTRGYFSPGEQKFREAVESLPDVPPARVQEYMAKYFLYWVSPPAYPSNNNLWWENLTFNNLSNYSEARDYSKPSALAPFVNNFSDYNIFYPDGRIEHGGNLSTLAQWQAASARDEHSQVLDPLAADAKLPEWIEAKRALWSQPLRPTKEVRALNLGLVDSPSAAECLARFYRSPQATRVITADANVQAWLLTVDGQRTLAVWTTTPGDHRPLRLRVGADSVTYENPYNAQTPRALQNGAIELMATSLPQYLRGVGAEVVEAPLASLTAQGFNAPGEVVPVMATFTNETKQPQKLQATFSASNGFSAQPATMTRTLQAGETLRVPLQLKADGTFPRGTGSVSLHAQLGSERITRSATFLVGEGGGKIGRAAKPFVIDGKLDDWKSLGSKALLGAIAEASQITSGERGGWTNADDLSAKLYGAWTPDALYIAVEVRDDNVMSAPEGAALYDWDAVEVFVDARDAAFQYNKEPTPGVFQIIVAPGENNQARVQVLAKTQLQDLASAATRTPGGYVVEMKIPLAAANFAAGGFDAGRAIKMSLLVDDRDNPQAPRENVLGWSFSPGGANYNETSGWKTLVLEK